MKTTVAIIGLGRMGKRHFTAFLKQPRCEIIAGAVHQPASITPAEDLLGVPVYLGDDIEQLLAEHGGSLDLAVIATPTRDHFPLAKLLFDHGISVLVEKPLALTETEAEELVALQETAGGPFIQVAHCLAHEGAVVSAAAAIARDAVGTLQSVTVSRCGPAETGRPPGDRPEPNEAYQQLIHMVSILHALADQPSTATDLIGETDLRRNRERFDVQLSFESGISGRLVANPEPGDNDGMSFEVEGSLGLLRGRIGRHPEVILERDGQTISLPVKRGNNLALQAMTALHHLRRGTQPPENAQRGLWAMRSARQVVGRAGFILRPDET